MKIIKYLPKFSKRKLKNKTLDVDLNLVPKMNLMHFKSSFQRKEIEIYIHFPV